MLWSWSIRFAPEHSICSILVSCKWFDGNWKISANVACFDVYAKVRLRFLIIGLYTLLFTPNKFKRTKYLIFEKFTLGLKIPSYKLKTIFILKNLKENFIIFYENSYLNTVINSVEILIIFGQNRRKDSRKYHIKQLPSNDNLLIKNRWATKR